MIRAPLALALATAAALALSSCGGAGGATASAGNSARAAAAPARAAAAPSYRNPVIPADFPDPTVMRVGRDYWATATNHGALVPVFGLMRSRDLVNWKPAGAVFPRPPRWTTQSWWAPDFLRLPGRLLVYYSAQRRDGGGRCIGVATAKQPAGPWRDQGPILCDPSNPIDPTAVRDGDRLYLFYKAEGAIHATALAPGGTSVTGPDRVVLQPGQDWERGLIEGPQVIHQGGTWALMYSGGACCGLQCVYAIGVARASSPLGPYEKASFNPILHASDTWRCPGHGGPVQDAEGRTWLLYHAYPRRGFGFVGRQALLDRVSWRDGWPRIGKGSEPTTLARAPSAPQRRTTATRDGFDGTALGSSWQWGEGARPSVRVRGGMLALAPAARQATAQLNFLTVPSPRYTALAAASGARPGLGAFWGPRAGVWVQRAGTQVTAWSAAAGNPKVVGRLTLASKRVFLRLSASFNRFRFAVSSDGRKWRAVGSRYAAPVSESWVFGTGIALRAGGRAKFDWIRVTLTR